MVFGLAMNVVMLLLSVAILGATLKIDGENTKVSQKQ